MDITETTPTRDSIEELIETIDELDDWSVDDWSLEAGADDTATVDLSAEWSAENDGAERRTRIQKMKEIVAAVEVEYDEGAPVDEVVTTAVARLELNEDEAYREIDNLRTKGEVYEPKQGKLRTTVIDTYSEGDL